MKSPDAGLPTAGVMGVAFARAEGSANLRRLPESRQVGAKPFERNDDESAGRKAGLGRGFVLQHESTLERAFGPFR
jgi:hypothetical protein